MIRGCLLLAGVLLSQTGMLSAHEVHHTVEQTAAVAIRLTYADGTPFAFEAFEAYPAGKDRPSRVGRTDDQGRVLFLPGETRHWRIKAFSADGHGVDLPIELPVITASDDARSVDGSSNGDGPNRASLLLFGVSILLALFGAYQLWSKRRS